MEQYGRSPANEVLGLIKDWHGLPEEERVYASARFVEEILKTFTKSEIST